MTLSEMLGGVSTWVHRLNEHLPLYWIQAEFSDFQVKGGHCYVELIEKNDAGVTVARIRANIWRGTLGALQRKFADATGRQMQSGMKVLVRGSINHHTAYGLSFVISDIDPSYTLGDMERIRREILAALKREGILDCNRTLLLSETPQRLAVISSESAAGYGDFINQTVNNPEGFAIYTRLFPAVMQGDRTASSVMAALAAVAETRDSWDAVVIIRGGGSTTDLNGFDNLELARAVATFPLPVIVGIGHERDRTVLDEIACVRCKTPTAVAAFIVDTLRSAYTRTVELVNRIARYGADTLRGEHLRLASLMQAVPATARTSLMRQKVRLTELAGGIPAAVQGKVTRQRVLLGEYAAGIGAAARARVSAGTATLERLAMRTGNAASTGIDRESMRLRRLDDMLRLLSPDNTLQRGYSITRVDGHAVTDPAAVPAGATVVTTLAAGELRSTATTPLTTALT